MADPPPPSPPPSSSQQPSTSSYIYPVRSLLSGIQPSAPDADSAPAPEYNVLLASLRRDAQLRAERQAQQPPSTPKTSSPGLGARRGMLPQGSLGINKPGGLSFLRDESVFSAPLPTKPEASSPTFFGAGQLTSSGSPLARRQSAAADHPEMASPPPSTSAQQRRVVSGLENRDQPQPSITQQVTSQGSASPETFRHYPAEGRDGFHRLLHLPPGEPVPNVAEELSTASGMAVVMHDSVDGAVIRSSVHGGSKTSASASGAGTGTSNAGTDASAQPSGAGSVQPPGSVQRSGAGSVQRSGTSSVQPGAAPGTGTLGARLLLYRRSATRLL
ncbi:hypothetical protein FRC12_006231 [Ceratobasidium sp. 428]|nr:hypothetical protein FRC12_006231 [Ceratobasidium sp. 428]